jgi:hypothetical protein
VSVKIFATDHAVARFRLRVCDEFDTCTTREIIETLALSATVLPDKKPYGFHIRQVDKPLCQFLCARDKIDYQIVIVKTVLGPVEIENDRIVTAFHKSVVPVVLGEVMATAKPLLKTMGRKELKTFVAELIDQKFGDDIDRRFDRFVARRDAP